MPDELKPPLHIIELRAENIKRLRAVRIRPDGGLVLLGGENTQGKSSCLDAIAMALGGGKEIPLEPVRHGARSASAFLDLGEFTVERTFSAKGTELVVRDKEGIAQASPQKLLDRLCSKVCFDPLKFMGMEPKQQDALLKTMLGLDFSDIEKKRSIAYEQRTNVNREVDRLKALVTSSDFDTTASKELVDVAALADKLQVHRNAVGARIALVALIDQDEAKVAGIDDQIQQLEDRIQELTGRRRALAGAITTRRDALPAEPAPVDDVEARLKTAEATNARVRARVEHESLVTKLETNEDQAAELTASINRADEERAERLAAAKFPIDGLGFDDAGPTFNGVPLAQASQAEQLRVSVAIGAAQNPRIRVMLVREGSRLDKASLQLLAELARETDSQVWVERVSDGDKGAIIIENGEVRSAAEETAGAA
ncbi:MAG TPA: AAA family ATPase [Polyangiaceae bacterium]|nr:AAA family ATPase [Polyangiaceae bacterium]